MTSWGMAEWMAVTLPSNAVRSVCREEPSTYITPKRSGQNDILKLINNRERFKIKPPQKLPFLTRLTVNKSSGSALTPSNNIQRNLDRHTHIRSHLDDAGDNSTFVRAHITSPLPVQTGSLLQAVTRSSQCSQQWGLNQSVGSLGNGHWGIIRN